jgi:hypothetical protein
MPGICPSQSAGWFQGMDEAEGLSEEHPARRAPAVIRRKATARFMAEFILPQKIS